MSKQLLVRTPITTDGITLKYDEAKQPQFKETILPLTARKDFEILNASLPEHLRHQLVEEDKEKVKR